ncbi:MAG: cytochrome P460 family protein, partial [Thermodesulfovibrionia bacterium]|nr:cytochrome P460 family protein [Thermodesulfovibrionia bacterium]
KGMANNSIIVKENYAPNKKLIAITVMYKVRGYNPKMGDWFWVKYDANFDILAEGKIKDCLNCHSTVKNNDYIFGGKVTGK